MVFARAAGLSMTLDTPKSPSLSTPPELMKMLPGFRSLPGQASRRETPGSKWN